MSRGVSLNIRATFNARVHETRMGIAGKGGAGGATGVSEAPSLPREDVRRRCRGGGVAAVGLGVGCGVCEWRGSLAGVLAGVRRWLRRGDEGTGEEGGEVRPERHSTAPAPGALNDRTACTSGAVWWFCVGGALVGVLPRVFGGESDAVAQRPVQRPPRVAAPHSSQ